MNSTIKKQFLLTWIFYILAVVMLICAVIAFITNHSSISAQLAQGATVKGNELAILYIYISGSMQYIGFALILFFCGWITQKVCQKEYTEKSVKALPVLTDETEFESDEEFTRWLTEDNGVSPSEQEEN
jgi:hypothetical protein